MKTIDHRDARLYGTVLVDFSVSERTIVGAGVSYNSDLGSPYPVPFLHYAYDAGWFRCELGIPSDAVVLFVPHECVEIGVKAVLTGEEYRVSVEGDDELDKMMVQTSTVDVDPVLGVRTVGGLWINLFGGYTLYNVFSAVDYEGDELLDIDLENTWFVAGGLAYRVPE